MGKQIVVLGMHRSGTSLVTNIVREMGAWVGQQESLLAAAQDNPRGFWERRDIMELNDALLLSAGATWFSVAGFKPERVPRDSRKTCLHQINTIIQEMDTHAPWVIKDPRMCLVLPLWKDFFTDAVYIFVSRNPVEIASSLRTRNQLSMNHAIALWEFYMLEALRETVASPRVLIAYSDLLQNPRETVAQFFADLSCAGVAGLQAVANDTLATIVDKNLYRAQAGQSSTSSYLNAEQEHLFASLEDKSCLAWRQVPNLSLGARDFLHFNREALRALQEKKEIEALMAQLSEYNNRLFDSFQYRFGRSLGAFCRRLLGKHHAVSLPERHIKEILEKLKTCGEQDRGK